MYVDIIPILFMYLQVLSQGSSNSIRPKSENGRYLFDVIRGMTAENFEVVKKYSANNGRITSTLVLHESISGTNNKTRINYIVSLYGKI